MAVVVYMDRQGKRPTTVMFHRGMSWDLYTDELVVWGHDEDGKDFKLAEFPRNKILGVWGVNDESDLAA